MLKQKLKDIYKDVKRVKVFYIRLLLLCDHVFPQFS